MKQEVKNVINLHTAQMNDIAPLIAEVVESGGSMKMYPKGISMLPMIRQGKDGVILSPKTERLKKYDIPLYVRDDGAYVLHRVVKVTDDGYTCVGDNQIGVERGVKHESVIAVVSAFTRNDKLYKTTELSYKLYCRVWHVTRPLRRVWRKVKRTFKSFCQKLRGR